MVDMDSHCPAYIGFDLMRMSTPVSSACQESLACNAIVFVLSTRAMCYLRTASILCIVVAVVWPAQKPVCVLQALPTWTKIDIYRIFGEFDDTFDCDLECVGITPVAISEPVQRSTRIKIETSFGATPVVASDSKQNERVLGKSCAATRLDVDPS